MTFGNVLTPGAVELSGCGRVFRRHLTTLIVPTIGLVIPRFILVHLVGRMHMFHGAGVR